MISTLPTEYKKEPHVSPKNFFETFEDDPKRNLAEKNMAKFLLTCGNDLSKLPIRGILPNEKGLRKTISEMELSKCHINAWILLFSMTNVNPSALPQLWFGVVDVWCDKVYQGLFIHSFLTILNGENKTSETIIDPYIHLHLMQGKKVHFSSYYAVPMPYFVLCNLQLYFAWSKGQAFEKGVNNLWADLKNDYFPIEGETERLIEIVLREKELRKKLFLFDKVGPFLIIYL